MVHLLQGDYSLVINDYVRARSLFANTQVQVFKKGELQFLAVSIVFMKLKLYYIHSLNIVEIEQGTYICHLLSTAEGSMLFVKSYLYQKHSTIFILKE